MDVPGPRKRSASPIQNMQMTATLTLYPCEKVRPASTRAPGSWVIPAPAIVLARVRVWPEYDRFVVILSDSENALRKRTSASLDSTMPSSKRTPNHNTIIVNTVTLSWPHPLSRGYDFIIKPLLLVAQKGQWQRSISFIILCLSLNSPAFQSLSESQQLGPPSATGRQRPKSARWRHSTS